MDGPVTRYEEAIQALMREPGRENNPTASRAHYDRACYVWPAPRWVGLHWEWS